MGELTELEKPPTIAGGCVGLMLGGLILGVLWGGFSCVKSLASPAPVETQVSTVTPIEDSEQGSSSSPSTSYSTPSYYYGGSSKKEYSDKGGHYIGGHGSSHKGGHYVSATGSRHYSSRR